MWIKYSANTDFWNLEKVRWLSVNNRYLENESVHSDERGVFDPVITYATIKLILCKMPVNIFF